MAHCFSGTWRIKNLSAATTGGVVQEEGHLTQVTLQLENSLQRLAT